ncbi:hypothetical protein JCM9140_4738 [Halalkalibacter wakoensis JCM 9140]|uniref:LysM domain-containing protein n=1 Tax=Halalkalibacter wakoensis JCM 9140 TaxID=1236970 RepID=W4QAV1_9BACI|nr:LysM domain-containing protein [Halalkalibacter wakoensis]GAE28494.1 hypothetical protein JCM9140_4738 [Halalkalibacter wakoensis JCM 9140]
MRKTTMFITPVIAAGMVLGVSNLSPKAESVTTMEDGDTLWSIAAEHEEVSVDDLLNINHS